MTRRGTIRNTGRVARELAEARKERAENRDRPAGLTPGELGILAAKAEARQQEEGAEAAPPKASHLDYAAEAEAAERAEAWPQAAALWRRAAECFPKHPCARAAADRDQYLVNAAACDRQAEVAATLEKIATGVLHIPTLRRRGSDSLDFHDLAAWRIRDGLRAAYEAGRQAAREG